MLNEHFPCTSVSFGLQLYLSIKTVLLSDTDFKESPASKQYSSADQDTINTDILVFLCSIFDQPKIKDE